MAASALSLPFLLKAFGRNNLFIDKNPKTKFCVLSLKPTQTKQRARFRVLQDPVSVIINLRTHLVPSEGGKGFVQDADEEALRSWLERSFFPLTDSSPPPPTLLMKHFVQLESSHTLLCSFAWSQGITWHLFLPFAVDQCSIPESLGASSLPALPPLLLIFQFDTRSCVLLDCGRVQPFLPRYLLDKTSGSCSSHLSPSPAQPPLWPSAAASSLPLSSALLSESFSPLITLTA